MTAQQLRTKLTGWFDTSFWVDMHYALAFVSTLVLIGVYAVTQKFDAGFAGFVTGMWITAVGNDKVNMPPVQGG